MRWYTSSALQPFSLWCTLKNLVTSSCTLCLRQKATLKVTCKKTIALQSALRITQGRAHNKFKKLSLMTFSLLHIINQHSKPRNDILISIASLINGSMCVIEFVLRDLISHKQEKTLSYKYIVGI